MKKILIIGEKYSPNLGDALIFSVVEEVFGNKYSIDVLDLSGRTKLINNETANYNKDMSFKKKILKKCKKISKKMGFLLKGKTMLRVINTFKRNFIKKVSIYKPDYILFAGGQLFMDSFFEQILFVIKFCEKNNISVAFNACGCSNEINLYEKKNIKKIINSKIVKYVSLRDRFDFVKKMDKNNIVYDTFDTAILLPKFFIPNKKKYTLGVGIMYTSFYDYKTQFDFWSNILNFLTDNQVNFKIFCNGAIDDYNFINEICTKNNINSDLICSRPLNEKELVDCVTSFNCLISMRLHSLIISYAYCIPSVAISWDRKVLEFFRKTDRESFCFNFDSDINKIKETLTKLENNIVDLDLQKEINEKINENIEHIYSVFDGKAN